MNKMHLTNIQHMLLKHLDELRDDTISALFNQVAGENPNIPQPAFASFLDRELGGLIDFGLIQVAREVRDFRHYSLDIIDSDKPEAEWPVSAWVEYNSFEQSWQSIGFAEGTPPAYVVLTDKGHEVFLMFNDL